MLTTCDGKKIVTKDYHKQTPHAIVKYFIDF